MQLLAVGENIKYPLWGYSINHKLCLLLFFMILYLIYPYLGDCDCGRPFGHSEMKSIHCNVKANEFTFQISHWCYCRTAVVSTTTTAHVIHVPMNFNNFYSMFRHIYMYRSMYVVHTTLASVYYIYIVWIFH